jgi:DNA-binding response OmpR family regulator
MRRKEVLPSHRFGPVRLKFATNVPVELCATADRCTRVAVESSSAGQPQRILCVDDEMTATGMRVQVLREHGYEVALYHSPFAALRSDLSIFDLAVLDFQMPGLNGKDLLLKMRARQARFPIVLLTGCLTEVSYEDRALFARCLDKGMPIRRLLETIALLLDPNQVPDQGS